MAFRKSQAVTEYQWPVTVEVPDNGRHRPHVFTGLFRIPVAEEAQELLASVRRGEIDELDFCRRVWSGWADGHIQEDDGTPLPPTPDHIEFFVQLPYFRRGLIRAYLDSQAGAAAAAKNSKGPPYGGSGAAR